MSEIVRDEELAVTLVSAVTKAAIISAVVPEIATSLLTVTTPAVFPPRALKFAAVTAVASASFTVIVIASVPAVDKAAKLANELAARVAVTTPVVFAAIASVSYTHLRAHET